MAAPASADFVDLKQLPIILKVLRSNQVVMICLVAAELKKKNCRIDAVDVQLPQNASRALMCSLDKAVAHEHICDFD